ncbi:MAG: hypothetical protein PHF56_11240 [Desulfuromonadaceae bacterium]|nr:hypothetical protein [Desulfuromonadaceae bacterium]
MNNIIDNIVVNCRSRASLLRGFLYLLIIGGCLLRVWIIWRYNPLDHIWSDPERHWVQGMETLRNDPLSLSDPIMYQLYIGALAKLTLKLPLLVWFYTSLLSLLTPWIWYRFFRELQPEKTIALAGCVAVAWLPSWISIYSYFMNETLMLPLLGAALYATWRARRKMTVASFVLMVLLWSVAGLTRGVCIPLAAVASVWVWFKHPCKIRTLLYSLLLLVLLLGPLTYRGYKMLHLFSPHGDGHMNAIYAGSGKKEILITYHRDGAIWNYGFTNPSLLIEPFSPLSHWKSQREGTVHIDVDINKGINGWKAAQSLWKPDFSRYIWLARENLVFLFFGPSWPDVNRDRSLLDEINYQSRWLWFPLTLSACAGTVLALRRKRIHLLLPALILAWFVVQGLIPISVNEGRYRKPYEGLLLAQLVLLAGTKRDKLTAS